MNNKTQKFNVEQCPAAYTRYMNKVWRAFNDLGKLLELFEKKGIIPNYKTFDINYFGHPLDDIKKIRISSIQNKILNYLLQGVEIYLDCFGQHWFLNEGCRVTVPKRTINAMKRKNLIEWDRNEKCFEITFLGRLIKERKY